MAGDGKVNDEWGVEGGKLLIGIWYVGSIFARNMERGRTFVSDNNGLMGIAGDAGDERTKKGVNP